MRTGIAAIAIMVLLVAKLASVQAGEDTDKEKIRGDWTVTAGEKAGHKGEDDPHKNAVFSFTGDEFTCKIGEKEHSGKFKLDSSKSPREISLTLEDHKLLGIYELKGDDLKICAGEERPKEFATKEGSKCMLLIFKRKKP
jgi:uncharacterized protein (TIGR03067 family)